ncbi:MAG: DUF1801 domain-containing protein [Planctomycetota bacterium]|nr:DUF1801 domain-containing protein [Planctomycetota bacterium]
MREPNPQVDAYLAEGCGRCPLGGTPRCKVHDWRPELKALRRILLDCGLTEERKWKMPCYTHGQRNVVILAAFKDYCALSFFKGALLKDPQGLLTKPGENSQAARQIRFTKAGEIARLAPALKAYIREAIDVEAAGLKVAFKKNPEPVPAELQAQLDAHSALKKAFEALTPGRQRGYILFISGAKQSQTRAARAEKCAPRILKGKGLNE